MLWEWDVSIYFCFGTCFEHGLVFWYIQKKRDDESWFEVYKFENTGYRWSLLPCSMANAGTAAGVFFDDAIVP